MPSDKRERQHNPRQRRLTWAGAAAMAVLALGACGGEAEPTEPAITDANELVQGAALSYDSGNGEPDPKEIRAVLGQMVFLAVVSDVPGTVKIEGAGVSQAVAPDKPSTVVFNTEEVGEFEVTLEGDGVDVALAQVEVRR